MLNAVEPEAVRGLSESELLDALVLAVDFARYWQPPEQEDLWCARPDALAALEPIARAVLASTHAQ